MENIENIITTLKTSWTDAQYQLTHPVVEEEPIIEESTLSFYEKVEKQLNSAIQNAIVGAENFKAKTPTTHSYVHYEAFPEVLYNELLQTPSLKEGLESIGFKFYVTHNGAPHPMVTFVLRF